MKAVMISIQPKWCELIASGKKTIEVRKTAPELETPFKCYIYCTKAKSKEERLILQPFGYELSGLESNLTYRSDGKVIGEFVCDRITEYMAEFTELHYFNAMDKSVALNKVVRVGYYDVENVPICYYETSNEEENPDDCELLKGSCLTFNELRNYIGITFYDKPIYAWHITDLVIYDKPKKLSEFKVECPLKNQINGDCQLCKYANFSHYGNRPKCNAYLTRPPLSWCYVEV